MSYRTAADILKEADERGMRRAFFVTALLLEMEAVLAHLQPLGSVPGRDGAIYECGVFTDMGQEWLIIVVETGPGTHPAQAAVTNAHVMFGDFEVQLLVGVAGSRKDEAPIGSVVASSHVYMPYSGKYGPKGFSARPRTFPLDGRLVGLAKKIRRDKTWPGRIKPPLDGALPDRETYPVNFPPVGVVAPIASVEAVLDDTDSELEALIASQCGDTCVVEMEGYGAVFAASFLEFFAASIRNAHTRRAYAHAVEEFLISCSGTGVRTILDIQPLHVAAYVEELTRSHAAPTAKQHLAAVRRMFDWLVIGQIVPTNPAASVRGPAYSVKRGKTPVLAPEEARALLDSIDILTPIGLRDRALIGLMVFSFARVGAALSLKVEDVYVQQRRLWIRLHEKGGKVHEMPCHHALEVYLDAYLDGCGLRSDPKGPLFRTIQRGRRGLTRTPLPQANAYAMIGRRASGSGIATKIGNHTFRATGITSYLKNGGQLEIAAAMANHSSTRTTQLYDRRADTVSLAEVERIRI